MSKTIYLTCCFLFFLALTTNSQEAKIELKVPEIQILDGDPFGIVIGGQYDREGYDKYGYDRYGYNRYGYDKYGYDRYGYDRYGYDRSGYDRNGYDRNGYDIYGNHRSNDRSYTGNTKYKHDNGKHLGWYKQKHKNKKHDLEDEYEEWDDD